VIALAARWGSPGSPRCSRWSTRPKRWPACAPAADGIGQRSSP